ncbi:type II toxin-antitoxin system RelE family toxin [Bacillus cereus]|uniref:type II toxin-antitoxin system RelE family toxin n=1 Tax=Bacillus cereus TaxID=1396 RepID=UPI0018793C97|nr:type II toxin-antitoxin system RelE/ParE family toxin [Bacillus cereus]MBE7123426.1 type II toxin-antitoxin system RelE/ParE family toxin [Bacillus cereus]
MYKVILDKQAEKFIKRLDGTSKNRIIKGIKELAENPFLDTNVKKLRGMENVYRKRVGDFRILYEVNNGELIILILKVGNRGEVYKK